jgi:uncharacterized protein YrrD
MCKEKTLPNDSLVNKNLIRKIETVTDAVFEQYDGLLLGFLIEKGCWFSNVQISPSDSAMANISAETVIAITSDYNVIHKTMDNIDILYGTRIITSEGRYLGVLIDFYFDEYPNLTKGNQRIHDFFLSTEKSLLSTAMPSLIEEQIIGLQTIIQNTDPKFLIPRRKLKSRATRMPTKSSLLQNASHIKMLLNCTMQKAFVLHQIAQQTVDVPDYGYLIQEDKLLTPRSSNIAEYLEVFDELYLSADSKSVQELGDRISIVAELIVGQVPIISHHQRFDPFKVKRSDLLPIVSLSIRRQLPIQYLGKYKGCLLLTK